MDKYVFSPLKRIFPRFCRLCDTSSDDYLCTDCSASFTLIDNACARCSLPLRLPPARLGPDGSIAQEKLVCGECIQQPPDFHQTLCAFEYTGNVVNAISKMKDSGDLQMAKHLSQALLSKVVRIYPSRTMRPELLIPTPMHWRRRWQRGFNQAAIICQHLSEQLLIPMQSPLVKKVHTKEQKKLSKTERKKNLTQSFGIDARALRKHSLLNKRIAIIDDVMTTGSTAQRLSEICLDAGAKHVEVWVLARTPKQLITT